MTSTNAKKNVHTSTKKHRTSGTPDAAHTDRLRKEVLKEIGQRIVTAKILSHLKPESADSGSKASTPQASHGKPSASASPNGAGGAMNPRAHSEQGAPSKAKPTTPKIPDPSKNGKGAKPPKAAPTKPASTSKVAIASKARKPRPLSALDAAAQVLAATKKPMRAADLVDALAAKNLWKSPNGKTPSATLSAAITREIAAKGKNARFRKAERGLFASSE